MTERETGCCDSVIDKLETACLAEHDNRQRIDLMLQFFVESGRDFPAYCMQLMQRVRELAQKEEYPIGEAYSYCNIGLLYLDRSETLAARSRLREALDRFRTINEIAGQVRCLTGLGACSNLNGDFIEALEYFRQALDLTRHDTASILYQWAIANLTRCHIDRQDYLQALSCIDRINIDEINSPVIRALCYLYQAMAFRHLGLSDKATVCLALAMDIDGVYVALRDQIHLEEARILQLNKRPDDAQRLLESVLARAGRSADRTLQAECLLTLGQLQAAKGYANQAALNYEKALDILVDTGFSVLELALVDAMKELRQVQ